MGAIGNDHPTAQSFLNYLHTISIFSTINQNISISDIKNYQVNSNGNVKFLITKPFVWRNNTFTENGVSYIFDPTGKVRFHTAYNQFNVDAEYFYIPNASLRGYDVNFPSASNDQLRLLVTRRVDVLGGHINGLVTPGADVTYMRGNGANATLIIPSEILTINNGLPDGDVGKITSRGGLEIYRDSSNYLHTKNPLKIFDLKVTQIYTTSIEVSFSTHLTSGWLIIFLNDYIHQWVKLEEFNNTIQNLLPANPYKLEIIIADYYFNLPLNNLFSNTVLFTTDV